MPTGTVTQGSGIKTAITEVDAGGTLRLVGDLDIRGIISADTQFTLDSTKIVTSELGVLEGAEKGTATSSKVLVADTNKAVSGLGSIGLQDSNLNIQKNSADTNDSQIVFKKSRNATVDGHTIVEGPVGEGVGDNLGSIQWYGSDGDKYVIGAQIQAKLDSLPGINDMPTELVFSTTPNNESTVVDRLSISETGDIYIHDGKSLRLRDNTGANDYIGFKANPNTTTHTLTMPATVGGASQYLMTDSSGNLSWSSIAEAASVRASCKASTIGSFTMASTASVSTLVLANGEGGYNGSGGFDNTNNTFISQDGFSLSENDRILIKDGVNSNDTGISNKWNGIYTVGSLSGTTLTLTRSTDYNSSSNIKTGSYTFIENGNVNNGKSFILITSDTVNVGVSLLEFSQFSVGGITEIIAGTGISGGSSSGSVTLSIDFTELPSQAPNLVDKIVMLDSDNTTDHLTSVSDFVTLVGSSLTSVINSSFTKIGTGVEQEYISFTTSNEINMCINNTPKLSIKNTGIEVSGSSKFTSSSTNEPVITIENTTNDSTSGILKFIKDKGAAGASGDTCGLIQFYGDDANQDQNLFSQIKSDIISHTDNEEGGRLTLSIASHDGELQSGIILSDGDAEDEIDVVIGSGVNSITTISGKMTTTGITIDGSEGLKIKNGSSGPGFMELYEDSDNGGNKIILTPPNGLPSSNPILTLPINTGTLVSSGDTGSVTNNMLSNSSIGIGTTTISLGSSSSSLIGLTNIDTTNIETTNIKAKDGTSSAIIEDSTGIMTIGSSVLTTTDINSGTIDNTSIGASTPSTGVFTTLTTNDQLVVNAGATIIGDNTSEITLNVRGVSDQTSHLFNIETDGGDDKLSVSSGGQTTITDLVATTADINGGTIDNSTIATSNITVGSGKTLNVTDGTLSLKDNQISGDKVEGGTIDAITINTLTST
ncbi:MAG: hypothetical protein CL734_03615, partial [Chloroflexi bacterium]|nr:hypothetical protein [Chloroflexota bacterium]